MGTYPGKGYPGSRWNPWGGQAPYGDGPGDGRMIRQGSRWFDKHYGEVFPYNEMFPDDDLF